jgi:hypothetical protein
MPGLVPGIHVLAPKKDVDGRDKPGHDENHQSELNYLHAWLHALRRLQRSRKISQF